MAKTYDELMHKSIQIYRKAAAMLVEKTLHEQDAIKMVATFGEERGRVEREHQLKLAEKAGKKVEKLKQKANKVYRKAHQTKEGKARAWQKKQKT
jgi:hypothetical protein